VDYSLLSDMFFKLIGGLAIFLLGMNNMSNGMQAVAGDKLRQLISAVTNNRFMAMSIGLVVTAIIQSSSVTSVMVVGFVNAGLMNLTQAICVILGADIGTTITGWILVLKIGKYGLLILGVSGLFYLFSSKEKVRYTAMMFMGIGMVFFGLELMKSGFKPIREVPQFLALFAKFSPATFSGLVSCALTGAVITAIVQSSSASVGIVMGMASTGVLNFETSVALVLGMNVGTTVTALLASIGTSTNAKRTAYGHFLIKIFGVVWFLPLFPLFMKILHSIAGADPSTILITNGIETYPHIIKGIALAHTIFNVANVMILIPFVTIIAGLLEKITIKKTAAEQHRLTKFDIRMLETPMMVIEQSRREILIMGKSIDDMFYTLEHVISENTSDDARIKNIFQQEEDMDIVQKEIATFLMDIISSDLTHIQVVEAQSQLRIADEYESISDSITDILKLHLKINVAGLKLTEVKINDMIGLHKQVVSFFNLINTAIYKRQPEVMTKVYAEGNAVTHHFRELRSKHLQRLSENRMDPLLSVSYMNMLNSYRSIKQHVQNVAEVLAGEK